MAGESELNILLKARDEASAALDRLTERTQHMRSQMKLAGAAMVGVGAAIAGALGMATKAAAEEESGMIRLRVAAENVGIAYDQVEGSLESWIDTMQQKTSIADTAQRDSLASLIRITRDVTEAQDLLTLAMDVAVGTNRDLESATTLLMYALSGNWGMLERYIPAIKEAKDEEEKWFMLRELFAGQAEAYGESMAGQYTLLKNNLSDIAESIGTVLLPVVKDVADWLNKMAQAIKDLPDPLIKAGVTATALAAALTTIGGGLILVVGYIPKLRAALHSASVAMAALKATTFATFTIFAVFSASVGAAVYSVQRLIDKLSGSGGATVQLTGYTEQLVLAKAAEQGFTGSVDECTDFLLKQVQATGEASDAAVLLTREAWQEQVALEALTQDLEEHTAAEWEAIEAEEKLLEIKEAATIAELERTRVLEEARDEMIRVAREAYDMALAERTAAVLAGGAREVIVEFTRAVIANGDSLEEAARNIGQYVAAMVQMQIAEKLIQEALEAFVTSIQEFGVGSEESTDAFRNLVDWMEHAIRVTGELEREFERLGLAMPEGAGGGTTPWFGGYQRGGVVPGAVGSPQLAVVHGGETITPASGGGGDGAGVVINVYPSAGKDEREIAREIYILEQNERRALGEVT